MNDLKIINKYESILDDIFIETDYTTNVENEFDTELAEK